ncbi:hypothetical protein C8R46DRAFT_1227438 [Mycena filopes]|nr:hypothetical protein C8R46DRAFT_1227438 [Mycena filopes]
MLRGSTIKGVVGELLGRQIGMSDGKGCPMRIFTPSFFGGNGIVGAGIGFAQKYTVKETVRLKAALLTKSAGRDRIARLEKTAATLIARVESMNAGIAQARADMAALTKLCASIEPKKTVEEPEPSQWVFDFTLGIATYIPGVATATGIATYLLTKLFRK